MKRLSILLLVLLVATSVSGQTATTTRFEQRQINLEERQLQRQEKLDEIKITRDEKKAELETKRAERKVKLQEAKKERITNITSKISEKLDNAIIRLENFSTKIQEKIEKFDEKQIDTTKSKELLELANQKLSDAKTEIANAKTDVETLLLGEEVSVNDFKNIFETARLSVKEVRQAHTDVVAELKSAISEKREETINDNN